jgi:hypothetical protein
MPRVEKTILQKISEELDILANLYNKTHNEKYKIEWYKLLRKIPIV